MEKHRDSSDERDERNLKRAQRIRDALAIRAAREKDVRVRPKPTISYRGAEHPGGLSYSYNGGENRGGKSL